MFRKVAWLTVLVVTTTSCALYKEVEVTPLLLSPASIERGADVHAMLRKADYLRAIEISDSIDARKKNPNELAALGSAYLAAGRYAEARSRLRAALDMNPFRPMYAEIAWNLSQVEYLSNNFDSSLEWANIAQEHGLLVKQWHLDYLKALSGVPVYSFGGANSVRLPFRFGRPDVPRINVKVNDREVEGIVDSGAVLSILSQRLAASLPVRKLGTFEGTYFGLLGEPITVQFGLLETLQIGEMRIQNVPVAIMPDDKMRFLISKREGKEFHMDFLLGTNLLKEFRIEMDFNRRNISFTRLLEADRRPAADQNLFFDGFRPHVRGAVNRKGWFLFILDTGSEITFLNQSRMGNLPVQLFGSAHTATLQGLGGALKRGAKLENVEVGIGDWAGRFKTIPMYSSDDKDVAVGIIGQNMLENFNVVIDFGRMRVDLKRR